MLTLIESIVYADIKNLEIERMNGMSVKSRFRRLKREQIIPFIEGDEMALDPFELEWLVEEFEKFIKKDRDSITWSKLTNEQRKTAINNNLDVNVVNRRLYDGWTIERAITEEVQGRTELSKYRKIAEKKGIRSDLFYRRVRDLGYSYEEAANTPVRKRGNKDAVS